MGGDFIISLYKEGKELVEYNKFKRMIEVEYLDPIKERLDNLVYEENCDDNLNEADKVLMEINKLNRNRINSTKYTLEDEIKHIDTDNKFKYIRVLNYVLDLQMYFITLSSLYTYRRIQGGMTEDNRKEYKFKKDKLEYWNENIYKKFNEYVKLEVNSLGATELREEFDDYIGDNK